MCVCVYVLKKYKNAYIGTGVEPQALKQTCLLFQSAGKFTKGLSLAFVLIFSVTSS